MAYEREGRLHADRPLTLRYRAGRGVTPPWTRVPIPALAADPKTDHAVLPTGVPALARLPAELPLQLSGTR